MKDDSPKPSHGAAANEAEWQRLHEETQDGGRIMKDDLPALDLKTATNEDIELAVAIHVAGWTHDAQHEGYWIPPGEKPMPNGSYYTAKPARFCYYATATIELIEKWVAQDRDYRLCDVQFSYNEKYPDGRWIVKLDGCIGGGHVGIAPALPRAACIALLRASGKVRIVE